MKSAKHLTLLLFVVGVASACGSDTTTPIAPSVRPVPVAPPPAPPSAGPGQGSIVIRELSPAAGATLAVQSDCPAGQVTRICTEAWRGTFDVLVDREMTNAVLTVTFYDGERKCGYGANTVDVVPVGEHVSFAVSRIVLSDEFGTFAAPCPLPVRINRIKAELWSNFSSWTNTLIQEFETAYTFSER